MIRRNLRTIMKFGIRTCIVFAVAIVLTIFYLKYESTNPQFENMNSTRKRSKSSIADKTLPNDEYNVSRSSVMNLHLNGREETKNTSVLNVKVKQENIQIAEHRSLSVPTNLHYQKNNSTTKQPEVLLTDKKLPEDVQKVLRSKVIDSRVVGKNETNNLFKGITNHAAQLENVQIPGNEFQPVINRIEADFIINGAQICGTRADYMTLLILVPSLPNHSTIRDAIRSTYGSYAKQRFTIQNSSVEVTVRLAFLVGKDNYIDSDSIIRSESKQHGDIIYANFVENYRNLTRKMLIGLKWVSVHCSDLSFLLKIDEDVFVNIPLLVRELHKRPYDEKGSIYGNLHRMSPVHRTGKWAVTKDEYLLLRYPIYAAGNSYVISGNIIPKMCMISQYIPYLSMEDVFITGVIAKSIGAKHESMRSFAYWREEEIGACYFLRDKRISMTKVTVHKMFNLWNASMSYHETCKVQLV